MKIPFRSKPDRSSLESDLEARLNDRRISRQVHSRDTAAGMARKRPTRWTAVNIALYERFLVGSKLAASRSLFSGDLG